jgi:poly-gamma-glutamate capsule biosynthesis protein CapA/YwtB (metallophosphatase superfamily)
MLGRGVARALGGAWTSAMADLRPELAAADVAFANLESPLTSAPPIVDGYDLRAPRAAGAALGDVGLDLASLANNHALDAGSAGLADTAGSLYENGVRPLDEACWSGAVSSTLLGFLAFDDTTEMLDVQQLAQNVADCANSTDFVVVSVHWGGEYQVVPSVRQRTLAKTIAAAGADVIVGHGTHVLQPIEWRDETVVLYSLGNLLFDQMYPTDCRLGAVIILTIGDGRVRRLAILPTETVRGRVRRVDGDAAAVITARLLPAHSKEGPAIAEIPVEVEVLH